MPELDSSPTSAKSGSGSPVLRIAIQGELGSNSHRAALDVARIAPPCPGTGTPNEVPQIVACSLSAEVFERLQDGSADIAVLPIENSLHGSVFEHYDLLLDHPVTVAGETMLRIRHNVIAAPGVRLDQIRKVLSHPVALSQCRRWLRARPQIQAVPFYDTAGSVKHVMSSGLSDVAGIAPALAAREYGAEVLVAGIEDHPENFTRFYVLQAVGAPLRFAQTPNKASLAFSLEHRPGSLMEALEVFRRGGLNLTKIESRPVPGKPWEYVFFVDLQFDQIVHFEHSLAALARCSQMVKELGRYLAAVGDPRSSIHPAGARNVGKSPAPEREE